MKKIMLLLLALSASACASSPQYRLGDFTAASSLNIRNLEYDLSSSVRVAGEDCYRIGQRPNDARLQRAMDKAIRNGQEQGIEGDLLVNVRIDQLNKYKPGFLSIPQKCNCVVVTGNLVKLKE
ncbi:hypothetical protein [Desulfoluna butyratoxydans]|uniref:hypothetical protein n=1 Tax=Desulfoluna butyratoxydans TaxID=231438 RepID=UPI0015D2C209|nr:hypothetical protein [Desulfoluna butyratoxydans]